jgi:HEAT repeat protein
MKSFASFVRIPFLALGVFALSLTFRAAAAATEDQLIKDLDSPNAGTVTSALQKLEKEYPTGTKALPTMKKLLTDKRDKVRRKSARVLGVLHAEVSDADVKAIVEMLKATEPDEIIDALKSLRGLKAPQAVPDILPLLNHKSPNVIRDSCRTLAVLGGKDVIPSIEPLLNHPVAAVKADAADAIFKLKAKS